MGEKKLVFFIFSDTLIGFVPLPSGTRRLCTSADQGGPARDGARKAGEEERRGEGDDDEDDEEDARKSASSSPRW